MYHCETWQLQQFSSESDGVRERRVRLVNDAGGILPKTEEFVNIASQALLQAETSKSCKKSPSMGQ